MEGDSSEDLRSAFVPAGALCAIFRFIFRRNPSDRSNCS